MSQTSSTQSPKQLRNDPADNHDGGKLRYDLIPTYPLRELCRVYTFGTKKYADHNWRKGMAWSRALGSLERHVQAFKAGDDIDPESQCLHLAAIAFRAFQLMEYGKTHPELDDRIKEREEFRQDGDISNRFIEESGSTDDRE